MLINTTSLFYLNAFLIDEVLFKSEYYVYRMASYFVFWKIWKKKEGCIIYVPSVCAGRNR